MKKTDQPLQILAINQVTSFLFRSVLDALVASGANVRLVTGSLESEEGYVPGFQIQMACKLKKTPAWRRIWTWSIFTLQAALALVKYRKCMAIIVTNPPLVPWIAPLVKRLFSVHYVELIYDVYPDVMERLGMIRPGGVISKHLKSLSAKSHLMADHIITISDRIQSTVQLQMGEKGYTLPVTVIPNWANINVLRPLSKDENPFAREYNLIGKFVIMYSGAFGASHDIPNLVEAARLLQDLPELRFVLIGGGTREQEVISMIHKQSLSNLLVLPWQPFDKIRYSLSCADCHIISQDIGMEGVSEPSKTFTALAVGAAIIGVAPPGTQIQHIIEKYHCGILIPPRASDELARAVRMLYQNPALCTDMRAKSRLAAETEFNAEICTKKYIELLGSL